MKTAKLMRALPELMKNVKSMLKLTDKLGISEYILLLCKNFIL